MSDSEPEEDSDFADDFLGESDQEEPEQKVETTATDKEFDPLKNVRVMVKDIEKNNLAMQLAVKHKYPILDFDVVDKCADSVDYTTLIVVDTYSPEQLTRAREVITSKGGIFMIVYTAGNLLHVFVDASRKPGKDCGALPLFEETGGDQLPTQLYRALCELKSAVSSETELTLEGFEAHFEESMRIRSAKKLKRYFKLRDLKIDDFDDWAIARTMTTLKYLIHTAPGTFGSEWQSYKFDLLGEDLDTPYTIGVPRVIVPTDEDVVWEEGYHDTWAMCGRKTLIIGSTKATEGTKYDLLTDPIASHKKLSSRVMDSMDSDGLHKYELTFASGKTAEIEIDGGSASDYLEMLSNDPSIDAQELFQTMADLTGKVLPTSTRKMLRSEIFWAFTKGKPDSFSKLLTAVLSSIVMDLEEKWPFDYIAQLYGHYRHKFRSRESRDHWSEPITINEDTLKGPAAARVFKDCLLTLGMGETSEGADALDVAKERGDAQWIRACLAYVKSQKASSNSEERMASEAVRWAAQSTRFVNEYLLHKQGKKGALALKTLSSAMIDFITDRGDIGSVDVFGLLWHWDDDSRRLMSEKVMMKLKSVLDYDTVHGDKCGWHWARDCILPHYMWLTDRDLGKAARERKAAKAKEAESKAEDDEKKEDKKDAAKKGKKGKRRESKAAAKHVDVKHETFSLLFDAVVDHVTHESSSKGGSEILDGFKKLVADAGQPAWQKICAFKPAKETLTLRQDLIPDGAISTVSETHCDSITAQADSLAFNAKKSFDTGVYMFTALQHAHMINPKFTKVMKESFGHLGNIQIGPVKGASRIEPKAEEYATEGKAHCYWPYSACVIDVIRCSITVETIEQFQRALIDVEQECDKVRDDDFKLWIVRCKNGFAQYADGAKKAGKLPTYYTDVKFNLGVSDKDPITGKRMSIIGEVQILFKCILDAKCKAHELYEVVRSKPLYVGAKRRIETDQSFASSLLLTGGHGRYLAGVIAEFPHMFKLEDLDFSLLVKNANTYNDAVRRDLAKAIMVISNPRSEKAIAEKFAAAVIKLEDPDWLIDDKKFKVVNGQKWTAHEWAFALAREFGAQSSVSAMEFLEMVFSEFDKDRNELGKFCSWLYACPDEWLPKLRYHKCFDLGNPLDWYGALLGRFKTCQSVVDYFEKYQPTGSHRLAYLRNAFFFCMSDSSEEMTESVEERTAIVKGLLTRWKGGDAKFWKADYSSLPAQFVPVFDAVVPKSLFHSIVGDCAWLIYSYMDMSEEQSWDKEKCLKFFGDDLPDKLKYEMDRSTHAVEKALTSDWLEDLTAAELRRLMPDWSKVDGSELEWWDCKDGQSTWQCVEAERIPLALEVIPSSLMDKWLAIADNLYCVIDAYNDDNIDEDTLLLLCASRPDATKAVFCAFTADYSPIIAVAKKEGSDGIDTIKKLLPSVCSMELKGKLEARLKDAKISGAVIIEIIGAC